MDRPEPTALPSSPRGDNAWFARHWRACDEATAPLALAGTGSEVPKEPALYLIRGRMSEGQ